MHNGDESPICLLKFRELNFCTVQEISKSFDCIHFEESECK